MGVTSTGLTIIFKPKEACFCVAKYCNFGLHVLYVPNYELERRRKGRIVTLLRFFEKRLEYKFMLERARSKLFRPFLGENDASRLADFLHWVRLRYDSQPSFTGIF